MALYYLDTSAAFKLLAAEEHAEAFLALYRAHRQLDQLGSVRIEVDYRGGLGCACHGLEFPTA
jgi:predicted nucleic acid-binding protein